MFNEIISTKEKPEGELTCRKYTPISMITDESYVDFCIKIYRKGIHPRFPDGGVMTQYLEGLENGAKINMEGPRG